MRSALLFLMFIWLPLAKAQDTYSMRRCSLLPITDSVGGAMASKVFEMVERILKENSWCHYQANSDLLSVFSRYREKLPQHLKTPGVVRVVAEKLKAGSILRINLVSEINGLEVQTDVVAQNGEDLLFSEKSLLGKDDLELAAETIRGWLELYGKLIPYDGRITGILGDQITMDVGKSQSVKIGQDFTIKRFIGLKKHPLLKKVVAWESRPLATGKIFSVSDDQALGAVKVYRSEARLQVGDWVRLESLKEDKALDDLRYPEKPKEDFGKLGMLSTYATIGTAAQNTSVSGNKRVGGMMYGFDARAEAWVTRNWFGLLQFSRAVGTMKKSSGSLSSDSSSYQRGSFKLGGGWKYLPLGFFYGPQVDVYAGYATNLYKMDYSAADGFGEFGINGFFAGVATNFPVARAYRALFRAEFIPFPTFNDQNGVYGSTKTTSWLQLETGVKYLWSPNITLDALLELTSAKATFKGNVKSVSAQDTALKLGASFNF